MRQREKKAYEAPETAATKLTPEGMVCLSTNMVFFITDDPSGTEINYGRQSYGSAEVESWN